MPLAPFIIRANDNTEVKREMLTRVGVPVESSAEHSAPDSEPTTLICFSHLRWNFVFQRPQHLMSRFAREMDVIFWEEPVEIAPREKITQEFLTLADSVLGIEPAAEPVKPVLRLFGRQVAVRS